MPLIHEAAALNMVDLIGKLLQSKASVADLDPDHRRTPLHYAAEHGHVQAVKLLLSYGARRECIDAYGLTAGDLARENGHLRVLALLEGHELDAALDDVEPPDQEYRILEDGTIEFPCPYCRDVLRVAAQYAGAQGRCRSCREPIVAPTPKGRPSPPTAFESTFVTDHMEAARLLFEEALPLLRIEDPEAIVRSYKRIARAWRSDDLLQGAPSAIRAIAEKNLKVYAALSDFSEFEVVVDTEEVAAAQVSAHCSESTRPIGIRVWRSTVDRLYICGGVDFIPHP